MPTPAIEISDVAKRFHLIHERNSTLKATIFNGFRRTVHEEFWALRGVSFEVEEGSTFGLIGHNGSGKSTLLKCLSRIYRPDRGNIATRGRMSALLELGAGFHPELSGRENVYLNGSILGMSKRDIDSRFDDIVEFAGLEEFIDTPVKNYSSGMFVRLGFSVAITVEPDVLLIDEVLAVGDASFQQRCTEKFAEIRQSGRTIVIVSHGLDTVRNICDRAAWLDHGELVKEGDASEVVSSYIDSVRDDRRAHESEPSSSSPERGEAGWHIHGVQFVDGTGREVEIAPSGSDLTIRVDIEVARAEDLTLLLGFYRTDGIAVASPWHRFRSADRGKQRVDYRIPALTLGGGSYTLDIQILDDRLQRVFAERARLARLTVRGDERADMLGRVVAFSGTWTVT